MLPRLAIGPSEQAVGRLVADDLMPYGTALTLARIFNLMFDIPTFQRP